MLDWKQQFLNHCKLWSAYVCPPVFLSSQTTDQLLSSLNLHFGQLNILLQILQHNKYINHKTPQPRPMIESHDIVQ